MPSSAASALSLLSLQLPAALRKSGSTQARPFLYARRRRAQRIELEPSSQTVSLGPPSETPLLTTSPVRTENQRVRPVSRRFGPDPERGPFRTGAEALVYQQPQLFFQDGDALFFFKQHLLVDDNQRLQRIDVFGKVFATLAMHWVVSDLPACLQQQVSFFYSTVV